jgi:hypothetical protein
MALKPVENLGCDVVTDRKAASGMIWASRPVLRPFVAPRRRALTEDWAAFCAKAPAAVVGLRNMATPP